MNRKQINKLNMFNAVDTVLTNYATAYNDKAAVKDVIERFRTNKTLIEDIATDLSAKTTGATTDKNNAKSELITAMQIAASQGVAYATKMNYQDMRVKLKYSKVELYNGSDEELTKRAGSIINVLREELPNMSGYDISEEEINELSTKLDNFRKSIGTKTTAKTSSSVGVKSLNELYFIVNNILKEELDFLMKKFTLTHSDFYKAYRIARKVADLGGSKSSAAAAPAPATEATSPTNN